MAAQNADAVAITGGTITGVTITGHASLDLASANNLSDVANVATARTNLGLGTIATQNANAVAITGGTVTGLTTLSATTGTFTNTTTSGTAALTVATIGTAAPGTNTTGLANTAFVQAAVAPLAPLASPNFTGVPTAPTAAPGTNTTQLADTAFVQAAVNLGTGTISTGKTVGTADCGVPIIAQGSAFYTVALPAVAGFFSGCRIEIVNNDTRGKTITVSGLSNGGFGYSGCGISNICPGQALTYHATSGGWVLERNPGAWRPLAAPTLFVDPSGSNNNDGLNAAAPLTLSFACIARGLIDTSANNIVVTLQLADGTYLGGGGQNLCSIIGNYGAGSPGLTFITGNTGTPGNVILEAGAAGTAVFTKDIGETEITGVALFGNGNSIGVSGAQGSIVDMLSNVLLGCMGTNGITMQFTQSAHLNIDGVQTLVPSCTQGVLINMTTNADVLAVAGFNFPAGVYSYTNSVFANQGGAWNFIGVGFTLTGTVTGVKFSNYAQGLFGAASAGYLYTNARPPSSFFPGNVNQAFPATFPTDFSVTTPFSAVPGCGAGDIGAMYAVIDATVNTWGSVVSVGGGGDYALIACSGIGGYTVIGQ